MADWWKLSNGEAIGEVLGERYRLVRLVAQGHHGPIYEAAVEGGGPSVALRVHMADDDARVRWRQLAARLPPPHPNILPVLDIGIEPHAFMVMELVANPRTLADVLGAPLPPPRARNIALQIAVALRASVYPHGGLRPANIFLGENDHVRVSDFGVRFAETQLNSTRSGPMPRYDIGKYLSPEIAPGRAEPDRRGDFFVVGSLLYEMLAGRPAFAGPEAGESPFTVLIDVMQNEPPPLPPSGLAAVVVRAMKKDPAERYQTADELADALITAP